MNKKLLMPLIYAGLTNLSYAVDDTARSMQEDFLERQSLVAQENQDVLLEKAALERLALLRGTDSNVYQLALIRSRLRLNENRSETKQLIDKLCQTSPNSYYCQQAKAYYDITDTQMKVKLKAFNMYETNGDGENAVKVIEEIFGGAPIEQNLRYRYYLMMGKIDGREQEAINGLKQITLDDPSNNLLNNEVQKYTKIFQANAYANWGMKHINNPQYNAEARRKIKEAINLDPTNKSVPYWKETLEDEVFYEGLQIADDLYNKKSYEKALEAYVKTFSLNKKSPYGYMGATKCALALNNENLFNQYSTQAIALSKNESKQEQIRIESSINSMRSELIIKQADKAELDGNNSKARQLRLKALNINPSDPWLRYSLAKDYQRNNEIEQAKKLYSTLNNKQLKDPTTAYTYGLFLYSINDLEGAVNVLKPVANSKDPEIRSFNIKLNQKLKTINYLTQAEQLEKDGNYSQAIVQRLLALEQDNNDNWNRYSLGKDYIQIGDKTKALNVFNDAPYDTRNVDDYIYPYALLLTSMDEDEKALKLIEPFTNNLNIKKISNEIRTKQIIQEAKVLYADGKYDQANKLLENESDSKVILTLANFEAENGNFESAKEKYQKVIDADNEKNLANVYYIEYAELCAKTNDKETSQKIATKLLEDQDNLSLKEKHQLAMLFNTLGDTNTSRDLFKQISSINIENQTNETSFDKAYALRDFAKISEPNERNELYRESLAIYDNKEELYKDDRNYTTALRSPDDKSTEDWLRASLRKSGSESYLNQSHILKGGVIFLRDSGTSGYSDIKAQNYILNYSQPFYDGRLQLQTDIIHMETGSLNTDPRESMYGTCFTIGCISQNNNHATLGSFAIGWKNEHWDADIGLIPKIKDDHSYANNDFAGSIAYNWDINDFGFALKAYRRQKNNSFLSLFGDFDPKTNTSYGAVRSNGIQLSGSYALNNDMGFWTNLHYELLRGKNVQNNSDLRWMGGYYYHIINENNEELTFGSRLMYWSFAHDLSGYTLGQGGYYSPQSYYSAGLSLAWKKRTDNWSWIIDLSVSEAISHKSPSDRYPIKSLLTESLTDLDAKSSSDNSSSFGYSAKLGIERRITDHLVIGTEINLSKSDDYSPKQGQIYFRYNFDIWNGDLPLPPQPVTQYAEW